MWGSSLIQKCFRPLPHPSRAHVALADSSWSYTSQEMPGLCVIQNLSTAPATQGGCCCTWWFWESPTARGIAGQTALASRSLKGLLIHFTLITSGCPAQSWALWAAGPRPGHRKATADHHCQSGSCLGLGRLWHCSKSRRNAQQPLSPQHPCVHPEHAR